MADVFVSYSRRDGEFVSRLVNDLRARGKDVWMDVEGIRDAEVFPAALLRAVEGSDAFVFVISPDSVRSPFCEQEVDRAAELHKRIVPLALRPVADAEIPAEIRFRNWIPAGAGDGFEQTVERLLVALEIDLEWEHRHTRITVKALEWEESGRDRAYLLRGADLTAAEAWLAAGATKRPGPSTLEREYLAAARAAAVRRWRALVAASLGVAAVAVGLLVFALISRAQAISARDVAASRALAADSQTQIDVDPERSILLAEAALRRSDTPEALFALRAALDASPIRFRLPDAGSQDCGEFITALPGVAFAPDGRQIAETTCQGDLLLADGRTGRVRRRVHLGGPVATVAYDGTGSLLATGAGGRVVLVDPSTGRRRGASGPRLAGAQIVAFDPGRPVVALDGHGAVTLWDTRTGRTRPLRFPAAALPFTAGPLAFSADGRRLAVVVVNRLQPGEIGLLVYDVASGRVLAADRSAITSAVAFSPDGRTLAAAQSPNAGSTENLVTALDARTLKRRRILHRLTDVQITTVAYSPDGAKVAYGGADGTAGLLDARTGAQLVPYQGQTAVVNGIAFSPDGRLVATASSDGTTRVWRATGQELADVPVRGGVDAMAPLRRGVSVLLEPPNGGVVVRTWARDGGRPGPPLALSASPNADADFISPDGRFAGLIPIPDREGRARTQVWSVPGRRLIARLPPLPAPSGGEPDFSRDGRRIAWGRSNRGAPPQLVVVDVPSGRSRVVASTPCQAGWRAQPFSPDGRLLAGGSFCGQVGVWSLATGRRVGRPITIGGELAGIAWSPDGRRIAIASWNSTITVADVHSGRAIALLTDHTKGVPAVEYSPDGRYLLSASLDGTARVWDARTLRILRVLTNAAPVTSAAFSPDGRRILTDSGELRWWDACTACGKARALLALARTRVTRRLTASERRTFGAG